MFFGESGGETWDFAALNQFSTENSEILHACRKYLGGSFLQKKIFVVQKLRELFTFRGFSGGRWSPILKILLNSKCLDGLKSY